MQEEQFFLDHQKLESFCLGLLSEEESAAIMLAIEKYPAVKKSVEAIEQGLLTAYKMPPAEALKQKIFRRIDQSANDAAALPLLEEDSSAASWNGRVQSIQPPPAPGNLAIVPLQQNSIAEIFVAWLYGTHEEEGHDPGVDFVESFLILEGSCTCNFGGKLIQLKAGDHIEIPPCTRHSIYPTSIQLNYVKAIVQRKKSA